MANYPSSLDNFVNPTTADTLDNPPHATQHADVNDAVEAIEAKLGIGTSTASGATTGYALVASAGGTTAWSQVGYEGITAGTADAGQVLTAQSGGTALWQDVPAPGLVHINTTAFSGAVSHSFGSNANPIFTSTYTNYLIILDDLLATTSVQDTFFRVRADTTDLTANDYYYQQAESTSTTQLNARVTATSSNKILAIGSTGKSSIVINIQNPQTAKITTMLSHANYIATTLLPVVWTTSGLVNNTNQYNGFTIFAGTNISGTMSVYGYKK